MPNYAWSCLACEQANPAGAAICSRCRCPAEATRAQVDAARLNYRRSTGLPAETALDVAALLRSLPLLLIAAVALLLIGALALIVGTNASMYAFGGLLIALAAFCASTHWNDALS